MEFRRDIYTVLRQCGYQSPHRRSANLVALGHKDPFIPDTGKSMSGDPAYEQLLAEAKRAWRRFDFEEHGPWFVYLQAHLYRRLSRSRCREFLDQQIREDAMLNRKYPGEFPPRPWMAEMLGEVR